jgi:putative phage-type endonuclease
MSADQGTKEWLAERAGKVTASRMADIFATTKTGPSASRTNYMADLVVQRMTGTIEQSFTNAAMQWGTDHEPFARAAYEILTGQIVEEVGFIAHPVIEMSGASPDGLVGNFGMIEIKCPNTATHIDFLLDGKIPGKYQLQMAWQMGCCDREWVDFASFDPRLPAGLQLKVVRFPRDDAQIKDMESKVIEFQKEVAAKVASLEKLMEFRP